MSPPFTLLFVHGDGSRVLRLRVPRWIAYGSLAMVAVVLAVVVGLSIERRQLTALRRRVADQRELMDAFQARVATVRNEIMDWKALHARMWEELGPEAGMNENASGVGGGTAVAPAEDAGIGVGPRNELDLLATSVAEEAPRLRDLEHVISHTGKIMSALPLRWPLRGPVKSEFGRRQSPWTGKPEQHDGMDIGASPGTPVEAPAVGKVLLAGSGGDYGRHVMLDHGNGVRSLYGHLRKLDVKSGQRVERGQVVGLVGSSGRSTGPHLHYQVMVQGKPVDPRAFLWDP